MEPEDDSGVKGTPPVYLQREDTLVRVVLNIKHIAGEGVGGVCLRQFLY